jgi:hypothetical protein
MAFVQGDKGSTASASTVANAGITTTTGNFLAVAISIDSGPKTLSTLTDTYGNTWVGATANPQAITGSNVYVYWAINITGGAGHVLTATFSGSASAAISVAEFSGRSTTSPILVQVANIEGARTASHTTATTGALGTSGCDIVALACDTAFFDSGANQSYTAGGLFTLPSSADVNTAGTNPTAYLFYQNNVGTSSQAATWTSSPGTTQSASVILALAPASGASGAVVAWIV